MPSVAHLAIIASLKGTPPVVSFTVSVSNLTASVDVSASYGTSAPIVSGTIDYGDGYIATTVTSSHTYAADGSYTITYTATQQDGQSASTSQSVTVSASVSSGGPNGVEPTGPNIVSVDSLSGVTLSDKIDNTPSGKQTSMGPNTYTFDGFNEQYSTQNAGFGVQVSKATALLGSGIDYTVVTMNAGTAGGKESPTSGTTFLEYFWTGTSIKLIQDLTLLGIPINDGDWTGAPTAPADTTNGVDTHKTRNIYNGFFLNTFSNGVMNRVKVVHIPGSIYYPPGETFGIDVYNTNTATFNDIILDGDNVGASGFGPNGSSDITVNRLEAYGWVYGIATAWATCGGYLRMTDCYFHDSRSGINLEQDHFSEVTITRPRFANISSGHHITVWGSSATSGSYDLGATNYTVNIYDPVFDTAKLQIKYYTNYSDGTTNINTKDMIHVFQNGVEVTSSIVQWV